MRVQRRPSVLHGANLDDDLNPAMMTCSNGCSKEWEDRMTHRFGFRPHPNWKLPRCPTVVLDGRRCQQPGPCICKHRLLDHRALWRDCDRQTIFTAEPYGASSEDLAELIAALHAIGLELQIEGYSPYYPGHTVLLVIGRREQLDRVEPQERPS